MDQGAKVNSLWEAVGNTPLLKIKSLSEMTGCEIYGKAEFMNPGGSVKDRAVKSIITEAEQSGKLKKNFTIFEGTAGNTGIAIATFAAERGYKSEIVMPDTQSSEKFSYLKALGAQVVAVKPCPFSDPLHFYHTAKRMSEECPNSFWANQFENTANLRAHFETTGPEIWQQLSQRLDHFVSAVGTGGTFAGVSCYLKSVDAKIQTTVADPAGSGIFSYIQTGEMKSEGSSITEGIGIMRLTQNFKEAKVDGALQVSDQQMLDMLTHVAQNEGLFVGPSAALNLYGAFMIGLKNQNSKKVIATILCDHGSRYQSRLLDNDWLKEKGLEVGCKLGSH